MLLRPRAHYVGTRRRQDPPPLRFGVAWPQPCEARSTAREKVPRLVSVVVLSGVQTLADLPPFTLPRVFTAWSPDPVLTVVTVWVAGLYLVGVWVLRSRG